MAGRLPRPTGRGSRRARLAVPALLALAALSPSAAAVPASGAVPTGTPPAGRAAALARPAVVVVWGEWSGYVRDHTGRLLFEGRPAEFPRVCTGFVVNPQGYVVTAGHCLYDGMDHYGARYGFVELGARYWVEQGWIDESRKEELVELGKATWTVEGKTPGSPPDLKLSVMWAASASGITKPQEVPARALEVRNVVEGDVALVKVEASNLPSILLAPEGGIEIGTPVLAVGYPGSTLRVTDLSFEPTFKAGTISAKRTWDGRPVYETNAPVSFGMSGGPTIDLEGRVVGLVHYWLMPEERSPFNLLSPSSMIAQVLARNGVQNALGSLDRLYRSGLEHYFAGDYGEAIADFDAVLAVAPSHLQAVEYKARAAEERYAAGADATPAPPRKPEGAGAPLGTIAGLAGATTAVAGAAAFAATRRARRRRRSAVAAAHPPAPAPPPAPARRA